MTLEQIAEFYKKQLLADTALIARTQNHDYVALASQNRSISARWAQKIEKQIVEGLNVQKEFDPSATSFMLQKDRNDNNSIVINEDFLKKILNK